MDLGGDRRNPPVKKKINIEALEDQVTDIMKSTEAIDEDSLGLSEDLKQRLGAADPDDLERMERELGVGIDEENIETFTAKTVDDDYDFGEVEDETIDVEVEAVKELPVDGKAYISIADDKMSASISLIPSKGSGNPLTIDKIKQHISSLNIVFGVDYDLLQGLVDNVENTKTDKTGVIFAKGIPPKEGKAGSIDYNFNENEDVLKEQQEYVIEKHVPGEESGK
jgi:hypothetical protein